MKMKEAHTARIEKHLSKQIFFNGRFASIRDWLRTLHDEGGRLVEAQVNVVADMTRAQYNRANNEEQYAHERRQKEAGKKTEYRVFRPNGNYHILGKIEMEFFRSL